MMTKAASSSTLLSVTIPINSNFTVKPLHSTICSSKPIKSFPSLCNSKPFVVASKPSWNLIEKRKNYRWTCQYGGKKKREAFLCEDDKDNFLVVNFYRFLFLQDPKAEIAKHLAFLEGFDIHGRIYLNEQGINAQYSGPSKDALAYVDWLRQDDRFSDLLVQISPAIDGHAFPRLKLRYKPSLVQYEGGTMKLPLLDPSMRAKPLTPTEWRKRLEKLNDVDNDLGSTVDRKCILLDVRNGYEWDIGHFHGASRPEVDCFRSTSFGLSQSEVDLDPLAKVDKEETEILMYCTGGIRCDVYSTILRQRGYKNLYTLKGGISNYLEKEGQSGWTGNLFVFDSRLSVPPGAYAVEAGKDSGTLGQARNTAVFARCYICGSKVHELRHRNCASIDCNRLFLCCADCVSNLRGCCCMSCTTAPRLRPVFYGHHRYQKWHVYRDSLVRNTTTVPSDS